MAEECLGKAGDLSGLLLLHTAKGSAGGLQQLVKLATGQKRQNVAFLCQLLLGNLGACVDLLIEAGRIPEAAFFARTYLPSRMSEACSLLTSHMPGDALCMLDVLAMDDSAACTLKRLPVVQPVPFLPSGGMQAAGP